MTCIDGLIHADSIQRDLRIQDW